MKKILVPVDFSTSTRNSAEYAASLAAAFNAQICLLHVYAEPMPAVEGGSAASMLSEEIKMRNSAALDKEKFFLEKKYGRKIETRLLAGFRSDTIKEMAESWKADLIVMGRRAAKKIMIFGSTIVKTVRKTKIPVLVIPENFTYKTPKKIVLAIDFEELVYHTTIEELSAMVKQFDAALTLLHIEQPEEVMPSNAVAGKLQWGLAMSKLTYTHENLQSEDVEDGILKYVSNHPADMLVMVAHQHNILQRLFGSIHTKTMTFSINLPLLILKN